MTITKLLVSHFADVNAKGPSGWTPLHYAAHDGQVELIDIIMAAHSKLKVNLVAQTDTGATPMFLAAQNCHPEAVGRFCSHPDAISTRRKDGWAPIHIAAAHGHVPVLDVLLANNAFVDFHSTSGATPLHLASQNGHVNAVEVLLKKNAQINLTDRDGALALHLACENNHIKVVEYLLTNKAMINARNGPGDTPLMRAVVASNKVVVDRLLTIGTAEEVKINPNLPDNEGRTPLIVACRTNQQDMAELLVKNGQVDLNAHDLNGMTCLHYACRHGMTRLCQLLLQKHASPSLPDVSGRTPLHVACQHGHRDCLVAIKTAMGSLFNANVQTQDGITSLYMAAQAGHIRVRYTIQCRMYKFSRWWAPGM